MKFQFRDEHYCNAIEKLEALDSVLMDGDTPRFEFLTYDTETNGLFFFKNVIIGFSISTDANTGYYIPLLEWHPDPKSDKIRTIDKVKRSVYEDGHFVCAWTGKIYPENVSPNEYRPPDFILMFARRWLANDGVRLGMWNAPFDCVMTQYNWDLDLAPYLWIDGALAKHVLDENNPIALKETASQWKRELGFNPDEDAKQEQKELGETVIRNGGKFNQRNKHVWRGDPWMVAKYGAADTCLTYGAIEVALQKFEQELTPWHLQWFFEEEVMPVCREVVIPMRMGGVYIDVEYFKKLERETQAAMDRLEDEIQAVIAPLIQDFSIGQSRDEAVSRGRFIKRIMELEGLSAPKKFDKKTGVWKETLGKKDVEKAYQENPHWLWGYMVGQDEIKYSPARQEEILNELYMEVLGRRYRFNIRSPDHLRWLFCDKLGADPTKLPQTDSATKDNPIPSMAAETIKDFFVKEHPWCKLLLKYKKLDKFQGTYIQPAIELNNKGWLHMDMKQAGTISGRFACSGGFNLQTLPKVEELDRCPSCESKKIEVTHPDVALLANFKCLECGFHDEDIVCPSAIKAGFVAPPGYKIINADYASLEPRCFAFMSGDAKIKEIFWKDLDMYSKVYCDMVDKEGKYSADPKSEKFLKKKNKAARDLFKPVVLGIPYGARPPQVANLMNLKITKVITDKETGERKEIEVLDVDKGREYRDLYLATYPDLAKYMEVRENEAMDRGWVETLIGRRRHFQYAPFVYRLLSHYGITKDEFLDAPYKACEGDTAMKGMLPRKALEYFCEHYRMSKRDVLENGGWNYIRNLFKNELNNAKNMPIQGLAGHIANRGMLDTTRDFRAKGIDGYVCLQVHDEVTSYARIDQAEIAATCLRKGMENNVFAKRIDVPMIADPIICDNLMDSK